MVANLYSREEWKKEYNKKSVESEWQEHRIAKIDIINTN